MICFRPQLRKLQHFCDNEYDVMVNDGGCKFGEPFVTFHILTCVKCIQNYGAILYLL